MYEAIFVAFALSHVNAMMCPVHSVTDRHQHRPIRLLFAAGGRAAILRGVANAALNISGVYVGA